MKSLFLFLSIAFFLTGYASDIGIPVKKIITGNLMIVPRNDQKGLDISKEKMRKNARKEEAADDAVWLEVWAYSKESQNWYRNGNKELDDNKENHRFPKHLPIALLQKIKEKDVLVFHWQDKKLFLTCGNKETRYYQQTFDEYVAQIAASAQQSGIN
jgi:hypothetical protein